MAVPPAPTIDEITADENGGMLWTSFATKVTHSDWSGRFVCIDNGPHSPKDPDRTTQIKVYAEYTKPGGGGTDTVLLETIVTGNEGNGIHPFIIPDNKYTHVRLKAQAINRSGSSQYGYSKTYPVFNAPVLSSASMTPSSGEVMEGSTVQVNFTASTINVTNTKIYFDVDLRVQEHIKEQNDNFYGIQRFVTLDSNESQHATATLPMNDTQWDYYSMRATCYHKGSHNLTHTNYKNYIKLGVLKIKRENRAPTDPGAINIVMNQQ